MIIANNRSSSIDRMRWTLKWLAMPVNPRARTILNRLRYVIAHHWHVHIADIMSRPLMHPPPPCRRSAAAPNSHAHLPRWRRSAAAPSNNQSHTRLLLWHKAAAAPVKRSSTSKSCSNLRSMRAARPPPPTIHALTSSQFMSTSLLNCSQGSSNLAT